MLGVLGGRVDAQEREGGKEKGVHQGLQASRRGAAGVNLWADRGEEF
jgi:hypothetical protein